MSTVIFNKKRHKPYSCAQYELEKIREMLAILAKKFTENLFYYKTINTEKQSCHITIIVPPFNVYKCYYYRFFLIENKWYNQSNFYVYKNKSFFYMMSNGKYESFQLRKFKNNKLLQVKRKLSLILFINNDKYINKKYINHNDNNIIMSVIYRNNINNDYYYDLTYNYDYIDNYIYKKRGPWGIHHKFIGNFRVIILFI